MKSACAMLLRFKHRRRYALTELPSGVVLLMTMFTLGQTWFWGQTATELAKVVIAEYDRYGPFYWSAVVCFAALFCVAFLALIWSCISMHLHKDLMARLFPQR